MNFKKEIAKLIEEVTNINWEELANYLEIPPETKMGDYAFPCFKLAKTLKKAPPLIATEIKENIKTENTIIEKIEVVGGYLNIFINKKLLVENVLKEIDEKKDKYGYSKIGEGKTAVIEYSSPNVAKPFHIGHLRTTVIGGSLYKIYNALGYNTVGINYLGDWGLQFGKVMAGLELWKDEYDLENDSINSLLKIYVRFSEEEKQNTELTDMARTWFKKLEDGDEYTGKTWEWIRKVSIENYNKTYKLLNSKFDSYNGEAYYNDKMDAIVKELEVKGLLKESQGAKVVDLEEYNMPPCIIITSAGTTIYATRDITAFIDRVNTYNFDKMVYVVGAEQKLHFEQFFKVLEKMGYGEYVKRAVHVPFGLVVDKNGEKIGSRKGNSVFLEDILNESINKSKKIIEEKNPNLENKDDVARKIGVGAIIFNDLYNSRIKDEIFDWDTILNFQGETGPYMQYIYVRTKSLMEKANYVPDINKVNFDLLQEDEVIDMAKLLYDFSNTIILAAEKNEPSIIARYLINLAQKFSTFYNNNKIINENKDLQEARLYLTYACGNVLKIGAGLLGMEMPDKM
ncbi:MAG: arginine--tRNA ligase [Clostridia bacterium]|nr:arginine--tRNA ligase [Clostridia bacterium]